ncbi:hypothetical protein [Jejuia spongiicola]|uniref:Uncharacterized protein n=1 Tax=Jejuia spongiicola TaxID=2942207 RepID=A0ABT0QB70_9FLAO|nr:hypothetical protein [Jejuia spongiicola]MCL6294225.1 hypothetical protein [Jejuia spongiicola]PIA79564.1 hypothetical protein BFR04_01600 [Gaetbulibacter sp. 4G1]
MESDVQSSFSGKLLDLAIDRDIINQKQYEDMWGVNVHRWLFGDDEIAKQTLINRIINLLHTHPTFNLLCISST